MISAFHLAYSRFSNVIPIIQARFKALGQYTTDLYQIYNKVIFILNFSIDYDFLEIFILIYWYWIFEKKKHDGSFNELLVETILREIGELSRQTQLSVNVFLKRLNNSEIVSWFVPNFETFGVLDYDMEEFTNNNLDHKAGDECSDEELAQAFSPEQTYGSEFSPAHSGHSIQNNKSNSQIMSSDMSNI